jgi:Uma2 family endonuclease
MATTEKVHPMTTSLIYAPLSPAELTQRWLDLLQQAGLPQRYEIDEFGEPVEMNPPKTAHQRIVFALQQQIAAQLGGEALPGVGVLTRIGIRIPDVVWQPRWPDADLASPAPQLCVEVLSPDNRRSEIEAKTRAYLEAGAHEVIVVETSGRIRFVGAGGERADSAFGLRLTLPAGTYPAP